MTQPFDPNQYYSLDEVAEKLKVSERTVRRSLEDQKQGGLPFITIGKQIRIQGQAIYSNAGSATYGGQK